MGHKTTSDEKRLHRLATYATVPEFTPPGETQTLAARGLKELFFQFLVLAGNRFWFTYLCIYVRGLAKMFWPNTSGYIVGTYIISD